MDVRDYCSNVEMELTAWKAKLYDVIRKIDQLPTGDKEKLYENIEGLHITMTELDDRIHELRTQCPTEWSPVREEIKVKVSDLAAKYEDAMQSLFDYTYAG